MADSSKSRDTVARTLVMAVLTSLVCSALVTTVAIALKPAQERNVCPGTDLHIRVRHRCRAVETRINANDLRLAVTLRLHHKEDQQERDHERDEPPFPTDAAPSRTWRRLSGSRLHDDWPAAAIQRDGLFTSEFPLNHERCTLKARLATRFAV